MSGLFDQISGFIYHYVDFLWLPVAWFTVAKQHRWYGQAFVLTSLVTLRTQVELMKSTGYETGFLPFMHSHIFPRGMIAWSIIIALFLILAYFSPRTKPVIFFAASLSIYIFAFCFSMLLMAL